MAPGISGSRQEEVSISEDGPSNLALKKMGKVMDKIKIKIKNAKEPCRESVTASIVPRTATAISPDIWVL